MVQLLKHTKVCEVLKLLAALGTAAAQTGDKGENHDENLNLFLDNQTRKIPHENGTNQQPLRPSLTKAKPNPPLPYSSNKISYKSRNKIAGKQPSHIVNVKDFKERKNTMAGGFESLGLMAEILRSVDEMGWNLPTDVQDEAIPLILGGGDVI